MHMKCIGILVLGLAISSIDSEAQVSTSGFGPTQSTTVTNTPWQIVTRDANSRVWQRNTYTAGTNGSTITRVHKVTELATGLHHQQNGQWCDSQENIQSLAGGGAAATNGQHQVYFPADLAQGEIQVVTPEGKQLLSRPVCISYDDGTNTVVLGILTNSVGELTGSNQVIYPSAFAGIAASVRYTYRKSGCEQDIIMMTREINVYNVLRTPIPGIGLHHG